MAVRYTVSVCKHRIAPSLGNSPTSGSPDKRPRRSCTPDCLCLPVHTILFTSQNKNMCVRVWRRQPRHQNAQQCALLRVRIVYEHPSIICLDKLTLAVPAVELRICLARALPMAPRFTLCAIGFPVPSLRPSWAAWPRQLLSAVSACLVVVVGRTHFANGPGDCVRFGWMCRRFLLAHACN